LIAARAPGVRHARAPAETARPVAFRL